MRIIRINTNKFKINNSGITLIEVVVGLGLLAILIQAVYFGFSNVLEAIGKDKSRFDGISILEKEIEIVAKKVMAGEDTEQALKEFSEKLSNSIKPKWYAHFSDGKNLLMIFSGKSFMMKIDKTGKEEKHSSS